MPHGSCGPDSLLVNRGGYKPSLLLPKKCLLFVQGYRVALCAICTGPAIVYIITNFLLTLHV